jgi:hypothetical protein
MCDAKFVLELKNHQKILSFLFNEPLVKLCNLISANLNVLLDIFIIFNEVSNSFFLLTRNENNANFVFLK